MAVNPLLPCSVSRLPSQSRLLRKPGPLAVTYDVSDEGLVQVAFSCFIRQLRDCQLQSAWHGVTGVVQSVLLSFRLARNLVGLSQGSCPP